jgi:hypothetical protein
MKAGRPGEIALVRIEAILQQLSDDAFRRQEGTQQLAATADLAALVAQLEADRDALRKSS